MNTPLKKLIILGLCSNLAYVIMQQTTDDNVYALARRLDTLARRSITKAHIKIAPSMAHKAQEYIKKVYVPGTEVDVVEILSLCLLGLMDLQHYSGEGTSVDAVLLHTMYFTKQFDPKLQDEKSHSAATRRYLEWLK